MSQSSDESATPLDPTRAAHTPQSPTNTPGSLAARFTTLGERLRMARYAARLTQQELAGENFSKSYLSAVERGKMTPSLPAMRLLAGRLGVSLAYLLGEEQIKSPSAPQQERPIEEDHLARRFDEAERLLERGDPNAALARLGGQETEAGLSNAHLARWNWLHGWALLQQRQIPEAIAFLKRGLEAEQISQDRRSIGHLYFTLANADAARNEDTAAEQALQKALWYAGQISDYALLSCVHETYGAFLAKRGRYQEAYEHMRHAADAARARSNNARTRGGEASNTEGE